MDREPFDMFLEQFSYLSEDQILKLPTWQQPIAWVHQLNLMHLFDGAASLFYNNPNAIGTIVISLKSVGAIEIATRIRRLERELLPQLQSELPDAQNEVVELVTREGRLAADASSLDELIEQQWTETHQRLERWARSNGWPSVFPTA